jgi:mono/diheme cytochrome c family protein
MSLVFSHRRHIFWSGLAVACCLLAFAAPAGNADDRSEEGMISFREQIQPIFRDNCQGCHQPAKAMGAYVLTDFERSLSAGETGEAAIVPGDPDASYLLAQIEPFEGEAAMPKDGPPLKEPEIELIRRWIAEGAEDDSPPAPEPYSQENLPKYQRPPVVTALDYSPDGRWLAVSGFHEVLIIDTESWTMEQRLVGLSERIESVCFSPDSKRLAVTGGSPGRFGEVQVWDIEQGELTMSRQLTYDTLSGGVFSPDGALVAFGGTDNVVRAVDAGDGRAAFTAGDTRGLDRGDRLQSQRHPFDIRWTRHDCQADRGRDRAVRRQHHVDHTRRPARRRECARSPSRAR